MWHVYIWDPNGKPYPGIATDLGKRMRQPGAWRLYPETYPDRFQATNRERESRGLAERQEDGPYRQNELALRKAERGVCPAVAQLRTLSCPPCQGTPAFPLQEYMIPCIYSLGINGVKMSP